ncbi:MAG TPA: hypothetical protein VNS58_10835 [Puia sp.]|nr:hypothetical protein [Puia sp.]
MGIIIMSLTVFCTRPTSLFAQERIVSLNGNISEMLCALGLEQQIAGVDVTSADPSERCIHPPYPGSPGPSPGGLTR